MRVLVCGGRSYANRRRLFYVLDRLNATEWVSDIVEGGASGADAIARDWAAARRRACTTFAADWQAHGRAAGPIRNALMLELGQPSLVIACSGGRGTAGMVRRARAAGVPVREVP